MYAKNLRFLSFFLIVHVLQFMFSLTLVTWTYATSVGNAASWIRCNIWKPICPPLTFPFEGLHLFEILTCPRQCSCLHAGAPELDASLLLYQAGLNLWLPAFPWINIFSSALNGKLQFTAPFWCSACKSLTKIKQHKLGGRAASAIQEKQPVPAQALTHWKTVKTAAQHQQPLAAPD